MVLQFTTDVLIISEIFKNFLLLQVMQYIIIIVIIIILIVVRFLECNLLKGTKKTSLLQDSLLFEIRFWDSKE